MLRQLVVTGGRDYDDWSKLEAVLDQLDPQEVLVGDCPTGVDAMVFEWCESNNVTCKVFKADWKGCGRAAGPIRNTQMLKAARCSTITLAFPGGAGTAHCVLESQHLRRTVLRVE